MTTKSISEIKNALIALRRELRARDLRWTRTGDGGRYCNIGAIYLQKGSRTYGHAWAVMRTIDGDGAAYSLIRARTAPELLAKIWAFVDGYRAAKNAEFADDIGE